MSLSLYLDYKYAYEKRSGAYKSHRFLQSNGINSVEELHEKITTMQGDYYALRGEIIGAEREIATLTKHLEMLEQYKANKTPKTDSGSKSPNRPQECAL